MLIEYIYGVFAVLLGLIALFINKDKDPPSLIAFLALLAIGAMFFAGSIKLDLAGLGLSLSLPVAVFAIILLRENAIRVGISVVLALASSIAIGVLLRGSVVSWFVFFVVFLATFMELRNSLLVALTLVASSFLAYLYSFIGEVLLIIIANIVSAYILVKLINVAKVDDPDVVEDEVSRKLTHLGALILVPAIIWGDLLAKAFQMVSLLGFGGLSESNFLNQLMLSLGIPILAVFFVVEYLRIHKGVSVLPIKLLRSTEMNHLAAYIYTITGLILVATFFDQQILIVSALVGLLSDAVAALVGKLYGKIKITKIRTLEGTIAGFLTAFLLTLILTGNIIGAFLVGLVLELFDVLNIWGFNDNLPYILLAALVLSLV